MINISHERISDPFLMNSLSVDQLMGIQNQAEEMANHGNLSQDDKIRLKKSLHRLRAIVQHASQIDEYYRGILDSGFYFSFVSVDSDSDEVVSLVIDGVQTGHDLLFNDSYDIRRFGKDPLSFCEESDEEGFSLLIPLIANRPYVDSSWYAKNALGHKDVFEIKLSMDNEPSSSEIIPQIQPLRASSVVASIDKITNTITKMAINTPEMIKIETGKEENSIVLAGISYCCNPINGNLSGPILTPFDMAVYGAICSLHEAGNRFITLQSINNFFHGPGVSREGTSLRMTKKQKKEYEESFEKLRHSFLKVDLSQDCNKYSFPYESFTLEDALISARKATVKVNGRICECYELKESPFLLEISKAKGQVIRIPSAIQELKMVGCKGLNTTSENIVLMHYMIRKGFPNYSNPKMLVDTIINEVLGDSYYQFSPSAQRNKRSDIVRKAISILSYWKDNGYIDDYKIEKVGKTIRAIEIIRKTKNVPEKNKYSNRRIASNI